jgi:hypothetical protein
MAPLRPSFTLIYTLGSYMISADDDMRPLA